MRDLPIYINDGLGLYSKEQKKCYKRLMGIRRNIEMNRIFHGTTVKITELEEGVYEIEYGQVWEKSQMELFTEQMATGIMRMCNQ